MSSEKLPPCDLSELLASLDSLDFVEQLDSFVERIAERQVLNMLDWCYYD